MLAWFVRFGYSILAVRPKMRGRFPRLLLMTLAKASAVNRLLKLFIPIVLSLAVLCYGVAWAFPRCAHEWDSSLNGETLEEPLLDHSHVSNVPEIECIVEGVYQIGMLGETSSAPRMTRFSDEVRLALSSDAGVSLEPNSFWLRGFLGPFTPFHRLSRHLFLSIFRI